MRTLFVALMMLALTIPVMAQSDCKELVAGTTKIQAPSGATEMALVDPRKTPPTILEKLPTALVVDGGNTVWAVTSADIDKIKNNATFQKTTDRTSVRLMFLKSDGVAFGQKIKFRVSGEDKDLVCDDEATDKADAAAGEDARAACDRLGKAEQDRLEKRRQVNHEGGFTQLVFTPEGELCHYNRTFGVVGDPIFVYLVSDGTLTGRPKAVFTPCSLEPAVPSIYVPAQFPTIPPEMATREPELLPLPMRRCFNTAVTITVTGRQQLTPESDDEKPIEFSHALEQYNRYRAGLQVGIVNSDQHTETWGLRSDGTSNHIFSKGTIKSGPEYTASLVLYSLPRYFSELTSDHRFYGRDIVNDQGLSDRIGGILGVGVTAPRDRFIAGLSFEVIRGINLVVVQEFARVNELAGVKEGDVFAGAETAIPTRKIWQNEIVFGLSLDARYVTALFNRQ